MFNARYGFTRYWRIIIITNYYFYVCLFDCLIFFFVMDVNSEVVCVCPINLYERLPTNTSQNLQFESPALYQKLWWLCHSCHYFVSQFDWLIRNIERVFFVFPRGNTTKGWGVAKCQKVVHVTVTVHNIISKMPEMCALL